MNSPPRPKDPLSLPGISRDGRFAIIKDVWLFVRETGKWWLVPILLALLLLGALAMLSGTGYAPFIYTLF